MELDHLVWWSYFVNLPVVTESCYSTVIKESQDLIHHLTAFGISDKMYF